MPPRTRTPHYFIDTSALAKRYVKEAGTPQVLHLFQRGGPESLVVSQLAPLEMRSLLRMAQASRRLAESQARAIGAALAGDLHTVVAVRQFEPDDWERAEALIGRQGLRPADALHLAAALAVAEGETEPDADWVFVCSDAALLAAARAEGLRTLDPAHETARA